MAAIDDVAAAIADDIAIAAAGGAADGTVDTADAVEEKITYNELQTAAVAQLTKFLADDNLGNFLLMGPGGSGKTTVIASAISAFPKKTFRFASFTNKAVSVFENALLRWRQKQQMKVSASTIHKLLCLDIEYGRDYDDIKFTFDRRRVQYLKDIDVVIVDECSTVAADIYQYLTETREYLFEYDHSIKYIFVGDFWQLPPINEEVSIVFANATAGKWPVAKLSKIMRAANDEIAEVNAFMIAWQTYFRTDTVECRQKTSRFLHEFPRNMFPADKIFPCGSNVYTAYFNRKTATPDIVIVTYSRKNCEKTNAAIQDMIDAKNNNDRKHKYSFFTGDKCCIDRPVEEPILLWKKTTEEHVVVNGTTKVTLYNGDVFDVVDVRDTKLQTSLCYDKIPFFDAQILFVRRSCDGKVANGNVHTLININPAQVETARQYAKRKYTRDMYNEIMGNFYGLFPKIVHGYCLTVYKAQGSEWASVIVNLSSIFHSLCNTKNAIKQVYQSVYTAVSRASKEVYLCF